MTKTSQKNVPVVGIELGGGHASDRASELGFNIRERHPNHDERMANSVDGT